MAFQHSHWKLLTTTLLVSSTLLVGAAQAQQPPAPNDPQAGGVQQPAPNSQSGTGSIGNDPDDGDGDGINPNRAPDGQTAGNPAPNGQAGEPNLQGEGNPVAGNTAPAGQPGAPIAGNSEGPADGGPTNPGPNPQGQPVGQAPLGNAPAGGSTEGGFFDNVFGGIFGGDNEGPDGQPVPQAQPGAPIAGNPEGPADGGPVNPGPVNPGPVGGNFGGPVNPGGPANPSAPNPGAPVPGGNFNLGGDFGDFSVPGAFAPADGGPVNPGPQGSFAGGPNNPQGTADAGESGGPDGPQGPNNPGPQGGFAGGPNNFGPGGAGGPAGGFGPAPIDGNVDPATAFIQSADAFVDNAFGNGQVEDVFGLRTLVDQNPDGAQTAFQNGAGNFADNFFGDNGQLLVDDQGNPFQVTDTGGRQLNDATTSAAGSAQYRGHIVDSKSVMGSADESGDADGGFFNSSQARIEITYTQDAPNSSAPETWLIPDSAAGYGTFNNHTFTSGLAGTGDIFYSASKNSVFFQGTQDGGTREFAGFIGKSLADRTTAPTSAYQFYKFTPELHIGSNASSGGLFLHGFEVVDDQLLPNNFAASQNGIAQAIMDWNSDRMLGTAIKWDYTDNSNYSFGVQGLFGSYNRNGAAGSNAFSGEWASFLVGLDGGNEGPEEGAYYGTLTTNDGHVFGTSGAVDGFVLEGEDTLGVSGAGNFRTKNGLVAQTTSPTEFGNQLSGKYSIGNENGFAAGSVTVEESNGTVSHDLYLNTDHTKVAMERDTTANGGLGTVGLDIEVHENGDTADRIRTLLGSKDASSPDSGNLYLGAEVYGIGERADSLQVVNNNVTQNTDTSNGFAVGANPLNTTVDPCPNCDFVRWGIWASNAKVSAPPGGGVQETITAIVPYMVGAMTQNLGSAGLTGSGNFSGGIVGQVVDSGNLIGRTGTFTATVDFDNRHLTDFAATLAGRQFGFTGQTHSIPGGGAAAYSGLSVSALDGGSAITGNINGALFGNAAQNIGGNFATGGGLASTGIYLGKQ